MQRALFCNTCGTRLTDWLREIASPEDARRLVRIDVGYEQCPVPRGHAFLIGSKALRAELRASQLWRETGKPDLWINPSDQTDASRWTKNERRLVGCCGPNGLSGANRICFCGAEIGTQSEDCTTWHLLMPAPANTEWKM